MKKMVSVLTALSMLTGMTAMTANADLREIEYSIIITDGSGLDSEEVDAIFGNSYSDKHHLKDSTGEEFNGQALYPVGFSLVELGNSYGPDARVYLMLTNALTSEDGYLFPYGDTLSKIRRLEKTNPHVTDIKMGDFYTLNDEVTVLCRALNMSYVLDDRYVDFNGNYSALENEILNDPVYLEYADLHENHEKAYAMVVHQLTEENAEVTRELVDARLVEAGDHTSVEMAEAYNTFRQEIQNKYEGRVVFCFDSFAFRLHDEDSIWENFGDVNMDGDITANDAAEILIHCAAAGSGSSDSSLDEELLAKGDINADGILDASDAANILAYSSAHGIGLDVDIRDYIQ